MHEYAICWRVNLYMGEKTKQNKTKQNKTKKNTISFIRFWYCSKKLAYTYFVVIIMVSVVKVFNLFYVIDKETDKRGHKRRGRLTRLSRKFYKQRRVAACAEVEEKKEE